MKPLDLRKPCPPPPPPESGRKERRRSGEKERGKGAWEGRKRKSKKEIQVLVGGKGGRTEGVGGSVPSSLAPQGRQ